MQRIHLIIVMTLAAGALLVGGCSRTPAESTPDSDNLKTAEFAVEGMTCSGCEAGIKMAVGRLDGVDSVTASHKEGVAEVRYDAAEVSPEEIVATIGKLGYEASLESPTTNREQE